MEQVPNDGDGDGYTVAGGDCNDVDALISPTRPDRVGNEVDENCDGLDGEDADGDGRASVESGGDDCDDANAAVLGPGAEDVADDGLDANCDGTDGVDADGDGSPDIASGGRDCDDGDPMVYPGAPERCDGEDQNCERGLDDEAGLLTVDGAATYHRLDEALRNARSGSTILVCPGAYSASVIVDRDVRLVGQGPREQIHLDARGAGPVISVTGGLLTATHLTLMGGAGRVGDDGIRRGGGVWIGEQGAGAVLTDVVIADNVADQGGGLYTDLDVVLVIKDSSFLRNTAEEGGAIRARGVSLDLVRTSFLGNVAWERGADLSADPMTTEGITRAPEVTLEDVEVGPHGDGAPDTSAVELTGANLSVLGGTFWGIHGTPVVVRPPTGSSPSAQIRMTDTVFTHNDGVEAGGLFDGGAGVLELTGLVFDGNRGGTGAVIVHADPRQARNATVARLSGLTFTENVGTAQAGGVTLFNANLVIEGCTFSGNSSTRATIEGSGGAIQASRSDREGTQASLRVANTTLLGNSAAMSGGALAVYGAYQVLVENSYVEGNTAARDGGAIWVSSGGSSPTLSLHDVLFSHDRAGGSGGAIATLGVQYDLFQLRFDDERAGVHGGAIDAAPYLENGVVREGTVKIDSVFLTDCQAGSAGGAIHTTAPSVTLSHVDSARTHASRGGAFAFDPYVRDGVAVGPAILLSRVTASATSAIRGGWIDAVGASLQVQDTEVASSTAQLGGAVYLQAHLGPDGRAVLSTSGVFTRTSISDSSATGSSSISRGGAIAGVGAYIATTDASFTGNSAPLGRGGAIGVVPSRLPDGRIDVRSTLAVVRTTFQANSAAEGGAIAVDAADGAVSDSWLIDNHAVVLGGGIALYDDSEVPGFLPFRLARTVIQQNSAPLGGGVYATSVDLTMQDVTTRANTANWGGGIALDAAFATRVDVRGGQVDANVASVRGGGIYAVAAQDLRLGWLNVRQTHLGADPTDNLPDDVAIEGRGSTHALAGNATLSCQPLDATCL